MIVRTHDVTHRGMNPDNLFWLDGHRVIGDFGIAHHADSAGLTEVGIKAGSWGYLPLPGEAASALVHRRRRHAACREGNSAPPGRRCASSS